MILHKIQTPINLYSYFPKMCLYLHLIHLNKKEGKSVNQMDKKIQMMKLRGKTRNFRKGSSGAYLSYSSLHKSI